MLHFLTERSPGTFTKCGSAQERSFAPLAPAPPTRCQASWQFQMRRGCVPVLPAYGPTAWRHCTLKACHRRHRIFPCPFDRSLNRYLALTDFRLTWGNPYISFVHPGLPHAVKHPKHLQRETIALQSANQNYSTQYSRVVPHHSTDCAITSLTSEIRRDPVLSGVYGRS